METTQRFEVLAVENQYDAEGLLVARYQPGVTYSVDDIDRYYLDYWISAGKARIVAPNCPHGKCILGDVSMTTNPGTKVVEAVKALKAEVEKAADSMIADVAKESERTKDGFHKVKTAVVEPWKAANDELDDFVNQLTNGGPPLDDEK